MPSNSKFLYELFRKAMKENPPYIKLSAVVDTEDPECRVKQIVDMKGCDEFLEETLTNLFITVCQNQPKLFINATNKALEELKRIAEEHPEK